MSRLSRRSVFRRTVIHRSGTRRCGTHRSGFRWLLAGSALAAVLVVGLVPLTRAGTASVAVPVTHSGYTSVQVTGARMVTLRNVVQAGKIVSTTVWVSGLDLSATVDIRLNGGAWTRCGGLGWGIYQWRLVTGYQCDGLSATAANALIAIQAKDVF